MMFVAQPYERFVDDLLTALTGGIVREECLFVNVDQQFALASAGAVPESIRVFGQRNESFVLFAPGVDYQFDPQNEAIIWKRAGRPPDERSYFYVNYHVGEEQRRLTDRNPGSVTTTLAEAFAREFAVLHQQMEMIYRSAFIDLATGGALDQVVALLGLTRRDGRFAVGEVLFKRTTPAPGDIAIPAGTIVSTNEGHNFETTDRRTLRRGQLSVIAPIRAQLEGLHSQVGSGAIRQINRPLFGVEAVVNERETFFAREKETDEELRRRLKGTLERAGKATVEAIKYSLIEDIPEITDTNIQVTDRNQQPGVVDVRLGLGNETNPELVRRIEESIFYAKPAGVRVIHNLPTATQPSSAGKTEQAGSTRPEVLADFARHHPPLAGDEPDQALRTGLSEAVLPLRIEVLLRLAEPSLSVAQQESVEAGVRARVIEYVESVPMGDPLIYNKLVGRIIDSEAIADVALLVGLRGSDQMYTTNLTTEGRKAEIDSLFVGLMEEQVRIDIQVTLEIPRGTVVTAENQMQLQADLRKGGAIYMAIERAISRKLDDVNVLPSTSDQAPPIRRLSTDELKSAIGAILSTLHTIVRYAASERDSGPLLQFVERNAVVVNAEYKETGRLLNNTDEINLNEHEVLKLGTLATTLSGVL